MANIPNVFLDFLRQMGTTALIGCPDSTRAGLIELEAAGAHEMLRLMPDALNPDALRLFAGKFI